MELFTKDSGKTIYTMEEESFIMQAVIFTKVNLLTIWLKVLVFINMLTEASTSDTGTKTNSTVLVKKNGMT